MQGAPVNMTSSHRIAGVIRAAVLAALVATGAAHAQLNTANVSVSQAVTGNPVAGGTVSLAVTIQAAPPEGVEILAISLRETLPAGATFQGITSSSPPAPSIKPEVGEDGVLEFAWIDVPDFPYLLNINVGLDETFTTPSDIVGQVEYRTTGVAEFSNTVTTTLVEQDNTPAWKQGIFAGCAAGGGDVASAWTDWLIVSMVLFALVALRFAQPRLALQRQRNQSK